MASRTPGNRGAPCCKTSAGKNNRPARSGRPGGRVGAPGARLLPCRRHPPHRVVRRGRAETRPQGAAGGLHRDVSGHLRASVAGVVPPSGRAGGAQYSARLPPRQAAASAAAGHPERRTICAPGKNMYRRFRGMFPPPGAPGAGPEKFAPGGTAVRKCGSSVQRHGAASSKMRRRSLFLVVPPKSCTEGDSPAVWRGSLRRGETAGRFRLARRARAGDGQQYRPAPERPAPAHRTTPSDAADATNAPRGAACPPRSGASRRRSRGAPGERGWGGRPRPGRRRWRSRCWCGAPRR